MGTLSAIPYSYQEEFNASGSLTIETYLKLSETEMRNFRALPLYFPVVRVGINETPRDMRLGQVLWSEHEDNYKLKIFLVDQARDLANPKDHGLFEPTMTNVQMTVSTIFGNR